MKSYIRAVCGFYPEKLISNEALMNLHPDWDLNELSKATGILNRHKLEEGLTSSDMAFTAAQSLFANEKMDPAEIDFLIYSSAQADYIIPPTANVLQHRLGLKSHTGCLDISSACTGYLFGLLTAKGIIESGQAKNVLLLTSDTVSRYCHPQSKSTVALFGDGAAATLLSATSVDDSRGIGHFVFGSDGAGGKKIFIQNGAAFAPYEANPAESIDEYGNLCSPNHMFMDGSAVVFFTLKTAPPMIRKVAEMNCIELEQIDRFVFHQASKIVIESVARKMKIPIEKLIMNLENSGNTGSSTVPLALEKAILTGEIKPGMTLALVAFGSGFSWISTIVHY
jgi:3-oxoacyl-[acyl-carrier-protein] synthase-3